MPGRSGPLKVRRNVRTTGVTLRRSRVHDVVPTTRRGHDALADDSPGSLRPAPPRFGLLAADCPPPERVLLVGNPNVGKSVLFGLLTGRYVVVSNYPGTTVEIVRGTGNVSGRRVQVIDMPGVGALSPNSEEEKVARDVVLEPGEKTVVHVADAKNLRRALFLTAQLAEFEIPTVLALNMWDEARDRGIEMDLARVQDEVGVPVVPMVATERRGLGGLISSLGRAAVPAFRPDYGEVIETAVAQVEKLLAGAVETGRRGVALTLLAGDGALEDTLASKAGSGFREALQAIREGTASSLPEPVSLAIQRRRAAHADVLIDKAVTKARVCGNAAGFWRSAFFFAAGPALFYAVGWRLASFFFYAISSGKPEHGCTGFTGSCPSCLSLYASHAAGLASMVLYSLSALRKEYFRGGSATAALGRLSTHPVAGLPLLIFVLWATYRVVGVFGAGDCVDFLEANVFGKIDEVSGEYGGLVNGPLSRGLAGLAGRESTVYAFFFGESSGLVSIGLTHAVAIVFPIVTLFFLAFALMEDSGYLPRLALLADRAFKRVGLSGKAVLPMVLGLGCGTLATMTTRILDTRRQRLIAILLLALAVPCSAQLGIIAAVLAGISPAGVLVYVGVVSGVLLAVGWGAAKVLPGEPADFLIEVPPFRRPGPRNVLVKTYHRVKWFMREAVPLFLLGTVCLFVAERTGILRLTERAARPLVSGLLGLPVGSTIAFILSFFRRDYGAVIIFDQFRRGQMGAEQALVALVVITLFVPCLAHLFVCVRELGWRRALLMDAMVLVLAFLVGGAVRALVAVTGLQVAVSVAEQAGSM